MPPTSTSEELRLQTSLRRAYILSWAAVGLSVISALLVWIVWPQTSYEIPYQSTGPGVIRYYDSETRELLHENSYGYMKMLSPLCSTKNPVWSKMEANIRFHWSKYNQWHQGRGPIVGEECYELDEVKRLGADAQPPSVGSGAR